MMKLKENKNIYILIISLIGIIVASVGISKTGIDELGKYGLIFVTSTILFNYNFVAIVIKRN